MTVFDISIISDTTCPWCYIGYRRLSKAITLYQKTYPGGSKDTFNIEWKAYFLKPDAPTEGVLILDRMRERMEDDQIERVQKHMTALGRAEGITLNYGGKTGNTRLSHRVLHFAKSKGLRKQSEIAEELFRLHFTEQGDITAMQTMLEAARNCDLDPDELQQWLEHDGGGEEVDREAAEVRAAGTKGVPKFEFQHGEFKVDNAGDTMEFFELLMKIKGDPCAS